MLVSSFALGLALLAPSIYAQNCPSGPTSRSYFSPVLLNDQVYIVGGSLDTLDIYALDLSQGLDTSCPSWSTPSNVQNNGQYAPFMYGVGFAGPSNNTIYVQSGVGGTDQMARVVQYNTAGSWGGVSEFGNSPSTRARMSASLNSTGTAFYYGGWWQSNGQTSYFNDFYSLDTNTNTWNWPSVQYGWGKAPPRYDHSAVLIHDLLFILGGVVNVNGTDIYADFRSAVVIDTVQNKALSMATTGDIPPGRYAFSAAPAPDGKSIVVFGGHNISASSTTFDGTSDVYVLDTCTLTWSKPDIRGTAPAARAGHGAVTYGNYMLVMFGFTDVVPLGEDRSPKYINDVAILDMSSWKWISSISHQDNPTAKADPGCKFSFPTFPETQADGGDDPMPYDPTVISNPNKTTSNTGSRNTGLAVGFSILALLLLIGGAIWWRRRQKKKAHAMNPRWLPGAVSLQRRNSNDYPLFVYGNEEGKDEKPKEAQDVGMRSYTATDHDAWQRALNQDPERPEDGRPMSRHMDVWERMRGLRDQQEAKAAESKLVDA